LATRHRFQVDGQPHTVIVDESDEGVRVAVDDGEAVLLDATTSGVPGYFSMIRDGKPVRAYVTREGRSLRVTVGSRTFLLAPGGAAGRGRGAVGAGVDPAGIITAPLAGVVVDIRVSEGEAFESRQVVVVIEAMKMQNEVQAPMHGTVTAIRCTQGERIEKGETVLEYTPADADDE
jgi:acetyl/propionyl-CoA carboxylase alpha subunit